MMFKYLLLALIPALVYGRIRLKVQAGKTEAETSVEYSGTNIEIISDKEQESFGIEDRPLKEACRRFVGSKPTDVYLKSPTPWNDVYRTYKWPQVQRVLKPVRSRILGLHTKPIIVSTREMINTSRYKAKYNAGISHSIEETVSNSWSIGNELTVGQEIEYGVTFPGGGTLGGKTSLSYAGSWGNETTKSTAYTMGSTSSVEVELSPGQAVVASLSATRGTLDIEIDYEAHLTGMVFANYRGKFRGHHFWAFPVGMVLMAGGHSQYINATEKISIGFYTSAKIEVTDRKMSHVITSAHAGIIKGPGTLPTSPENGLRN